MVQLDYQTDNPRWGWSGVCFQDWISYSRTLGYLSNRDHYKNICGGDISLRIEGNDEQGAWDEEGRIHYYGDLSMLKSDLKDLYACGSAGTGKITRRINSNGYINSLITDYHFQVCPRSSGTTADVFPPNSAVDVKALLEQYLELKDLRDTEIDHCLDAFDDGFSL